MVSRRDQKKQVAKVSPSNPAVSAAMTSASVGLVTAAIGYLMTDSPVGMMLAGISPTLKYAIEKAQYEVVKQQRSRLLSKTQDELGIDEAGLRDAILNAGPGGLPLTLEVFEIVARTVDDEKVDALARVWAHGLHDGDDLHEDLTSRFHADSWRGVSE